MRFLTCAAICSALTALSIRAALTTAATPPNVETRNTPQTQVYIRTVPPDAKVKVDGKSKGESPLLITVPPGVGSVVVEFELDGFATEKHDITVQGGRIKRLEFVLREQPGAKVETAETSISADEAEIRRVIARGMSAAIKGDKKATADMLLPERRGVLDHLKNHLEELKGAIAKGLKVTEIENVWVIGNTALAATEFAQLDDPKRPNRMCMIYMLKKHDGEWLVDKTGAVDSAQLETALGRIATERQALDVMSSHSKVTTRASWPDDHKTADESMRRPRFGPVHDAQLVHSVGHVAVLLDLDVGGWATSHEFGADDRQTHAWIRENKVDVLGVVEAERPGLLLFDAAVIEIPQERWETITAAEIVGDERLNQQEPKDITTLTSSEPGLEPERRPTCIFQTREGTYGLLQVLVATDSPMGVACRYRLVKRARVGSSEEVKLGRLDLRIVPTRDNSKAQVDAETIQHYANQLEEEGPFVGRDRGDPFGWFQLRCDADSNVITAEHQGHLFTLLSNRSPEVMLAIGWKAGPWKLTQVQLTADGHGQPAVGIEMDEAGGKRMRELTEAFLGCRVAMLVDQQVVSMPVIRSAIGQRIEITGNFTREEVQTLVRTLRTSVVPQSSAAATKPRERQFVRIVVGKNEMTFEGEPTTWAELPDLLEAVPNRPSTVLEVAIASDEMSVRERNEASSRAFPLARRFGFEYLSYVGVHPLGSTAAPSQQQSNP